MDRDKLHKEIIQAAKEAYPPGEDFSLDYLNGRLGELLAQYDHHDISADLVDKSLISHIGDVAKEKRSLADVCEDLETSVMMYEAVIGNIWLHTSFKRITMPMTTEEKEVYWAAVKADYNRGHEDDKLEELSDAHYCWWRPDYVPPVQGIV